MAADQREEEEGRAKKEQKVSTPAHTHGGGGPSREMQARRPKRDGGGGGGVGTRPWWLALLACGGAYWPLTCEPSAMPSRHPHCRGHPPAWGGNPECTFCPWRPPLTA